MNTSTLERSTITVQRIIPPTGNRKSATIKDIDGVMFGVWPNQLGIYREGESYEIEYTVSEKGFRDIKKGTMIARQPSSQFSGGHDDRQPARAAAPDPQRQTTSPNGNGGGQYYRPTAPRDSERMFVCSTLNAFIQTGRIDPAREHMVAAINELRAAYAATFGQDDPR